MNPMMQWFAIGCMWYRGDFEGALAATAKLCGGQWTHEINKG